LRGTRDQVVSTAGVIAWSRETSHTLPPVSVVKKFGAWASDDGDICPRACRDLALWCVEIETTVAKEFSWQWSSDETLGVDLASRHVPHGNGTLDLATSEVQKRAREKDTVQWIDSGEACRRSSHT